LTSPQKIRELSTEVISNFKKSLDVIASLPPASRNFSNTVKAFSEAEGEFASAQSSCTFPSSVSSDKETRDVSNEVQTKLEAAQTDAFAREDLYQALMQYKTQNKEEADSLVGEEGRLLEHLLLDYKRSGMDLSKEDRERVTKIKTSMSELKTKFQQNLNEDMTRVEFKLKDLEGMSEDYLESLEKKEVDGEKIYIVSLKYPDLVPILQLCKVEETRRKMDEANSRKCQTENTKLLEQIIQLRQEEAKLLSYSSPAAYSLETKMAKNPETVISFLEDLCQKLDGAAHKDLEILLNMKKEEKKSRGEEFDGKLNIWDWRYYENILLEKEYQVDHNKIKEYFPLDKVTEGLLSIYQRLLGLKFTKMSAEEKHVWHEDVDQFTVSDITDNRTIGYFYLDLHPRDGKYGHAAEFGLLQGFSLPDGSRQYPSAAMVANFTKPTPNKPSLLLFSEVETYFHEFGHVMHEICSTARFQRFAGTNTQRDFVEAPSQMLENWCYDSDALKLLSAHYKTGETLPEELRSKLIKAKNVMEAFKNRRQIFFALFDMTVHTISGPVDTAIIWSNLISKIALTPNQAGTNGAATFGHIVGGYEAGYYGYLWSKVYSCDMFQKFQKEGVLNENLGRKYRDIILAKGATVDAMDLLLEFLGRTPNNEAFLKEIGV